MARVAFFIEQLPPSNDPVADFAYDLMLSLADQQHEVRVFSTYRPGDLLPGHPANLEILRPFRRWSWLELPRLIPILMDFQPDILHLMQPRREALGGFTNAMSAIPALVPMIGRPAVASSFYDLREESLSTHRLLLLASQLVTVSNERQAQLIDAWFEHHERSLRATILPLSATNPQNRTEIDLESERDADQSNLIDHTDSVFIPGDISDHRDVDALFHLLGEILRTHPAIHLSFGGGWGTITPPQRRSLMRIFGQGSDVGGRVTITGTLTHEDEQRALSQARVVFAASLPAESLKMSRLLRDALGAAALLVLARSQTEVDTLPWRDGEHALISGETAMEWGTSLARALAFPDRGESLRRRLPDFALSAAVDQPANVMSRLYSQLLASPRRA